MYGYIYIYIIHDYMYIQTLRRMREIDDIMSFCDIFFSELRGTIEENLMREQQLAEHLSTLAFFWIFGGSRYVADFEIA